MGRLFWKFFFAFFAAQLVASLVVGYAVSLTHDPQWRQTPGFPDGPPPPPPVWAEAPVAGQQPAPPLQGAGKPLRPPRDGLPLPFLPLLAGLIGSLGASALLAWYFSRPIRHLRWALGEIAEGRFDTRVQQLMDGRRDELADLGRDVDATAHKLDQLVATQRRLLHDVSHELRSPLARIQAAIGLARQDANKSELTLERVERETVRIDRLVGQLLALARLDAGTSAEPPVELDVVDLLADVVQDVRFEARAAGRDVDFDGEPGFVMPCRAELLRRAVENVLRNAVKYTAEGTTIDVSAKRMNSGWLRISVCDCGPGVAPSELSAIFEPFRRVAGDAQEGFGLGLAIAKRAIEAHGGSIQAENRAEGGLCVVIELPKQ